MEKPDSEHLCISHLLSLKNKKYAVGLFSEEGLFLNEEWLFSIHKNENGGYDRYEYNMKTNVLKLSKKENEDNEFVSIDTSDIESNCVIDVSNNGMHLEGSCKKHSPLGPVCLMNESNELVYRGVMIGDKKECFGVDFYPGLDKIEYIGCYCNNERHGYGMLYDRKGELVYEGDWLYGSNEYDVNALVKDINNDRMVHSLIHELVIDEEVGNEYKGDLLLCGFNNLERIVVNTDSFQNVKCLKISDNPMLKSIEIEDALCSLGYDEMPEEDLRDGVFEYVERVIITSNLID